MRVTCNEIQKNLYCEIEWIEEDVACIMEGNERRVRIVELLGQKEIPLTGTELAEELGVSRQVVVQDIALLRATNKNILSTNKGYILAKDSKEPVKAVRTFKVKHADEDTEKELQCIIDCGGRVRDVVVEHAIYGLITVDLILNSRLDIKKFMEKLKTTNALPLNFLTEGEHFHTVEADEEAILDMIEEELRKCGYLVEV